MQLLPPTPRIPHPQKALQHELPHDPQLLLELSWVSQFIGFPLHAPHPAWHPLHVPPPHARWFGQSVSVQHCWQTPMQATSPIGQSHVPASLLSNEVLQATSHSPSLVQMAVPFVGAGQAPPHPFAQPASGLSGWSCTHDIPHMWNPPAQLLQPGPVRPVGQSTLPSPLVASLVLPSPVVSSAPEPPFAQPTARQAKIITTRKAEALR